MKIENNRRDKLIDAALSCVILFTPPVAVSVVIWLWINILS